MPLAERAGLHDLAATHVRVPGSAGSNADVKVAALVAGMVAGADTIDAMDLLRHGGHYVFTVKRNQPSLHTRLSALPWAQVPIGHLSIERGHRRTEQRAIQLISTLHPRLGFPHARLSARIAALVRGHWVVENQLHWIRDITLGEDAHHLRTGTAPQAMATVRNTALALLQIAGASTISTTAAALSRRVHRVLTVLEP
jgi:predicted transposase YbfD/YdcC